MKYFLILFTLFSNVQLEGEYEAECETKAVRCKGYCMAYSYTRDCEWCFLVRDRCLKNKPEFKVPDDF